MLSVKLPMSVFLRHACAWLVWSVSLWTFEAAAAQRALLVGVSELVNQAQSLWLQAPRNDVILMRDTLLAQGFKASDIITLADGVPGAAMPDATRIHEALARMLKDSQSGDTVVLYFSGHGTRLNDSAKTYQEPDDLAEIFLARDARTTTAGKEATLDGQIKDTDFGRWIKAFLAKNVFVWSLFDTCSAASMTRGVSANSTLLNEDIRFRGLTLTDLVLNKASKIKLSILGKSFDIAAPKDTTNKAQYIAFFASESHQVSPELRLPRKQRDALPHGLLTWAVADAFKKKPETWRELYQGVLSAYPPVIEELQQLFPNRELPSPVAEGDLDYKIFSNQKPSAASRPTWLAQRVGGSLTLKSGWLDGLELGQSVSVTAVKNDGTALAAEALLATVGPSTARLTVPALLASLPQVNTWKVTALSEPAAIGLRVRSDNPLPAGIRLPYPASVKRVTDSAFDVQVTTLAAGAYSLQALPALANALQSNAEKLTDATALQRRLQDLAQWKWLAYVTDQAKDMELQGFSATLEVSSSGRVVRSDALSVDTVVKPLAPQNTANLVVRNTSGKSLDLIIAEQDSVGQLYPIYPEDLSETNRFERGTKQFPAIKSFKLPAARDRYGSRLVVIAGLAQSLSQPRLFGASPRDTSTDIRVRGQLTLDKERQIFASILKWSDDALPKK